MVSTENKDIKRGIMTIFLTELKLSIEEMSMLIHHFAIMSRMIKIGFVIITREEFFETAIYFHNFLIISTCKRVAIYLIKIIHIS